MDNKEKVLIWLLVYLICLSGTIGGICYFDLVACGRTGDTRDWLLNLISVVVGMLAGMKASK